jgi:hypothetical protein
MGLQTQPFTISTYPVPLLFLLCLTSVLSLSDLRRAVTKVKYTFFLLSSFMHVSSSSFDLVLRAKTIGEDPPLKGQENAAH